jgi:hypothetical protein
MRQEESRGNRTVGFRGRGRALALACLSPDAERGCGNRSVAADVVAHAPQARVAASRAWRRIIAEHAEARGAVVAKLFRFVAGTDAADIGTGLTERGTEFTAISASETRKHLAAASRCRVEKTSVAPPAALGQGGSGIGWDGHAWPGTIACRCRPCRTPDRPFLGTDCRAFACGCACGMVLVLTGTVLMARRG